MTQASLLALGRRLLELAPARREQFVRSLDSDGLELVEQVIGDPDFARYAMSMRYRQDPVGWVETRLGGELWSKQRAVLESIRDNRYTAVPSAHDCGKSFTASRACGWWLEAHPPGSAFCVSTAPTGDQVRGVLWREINRMHASAPGGMPGRVNLSQWYIGGELVAIGRKPANANPAAFQGLHAEYILVVIDEADGVADAIFDAAADTLATNVTARVLAIGNPDRSTGPFHKACLPGSGWNVVRISAFDTPAYTGETVSDFLLSVLVSKEWVDERERKWGRNDPRYSAKVLGVAPPASPNATIPYGRLVACVNVDPDGGDGPEPVRAERTDQDRKLGLPGRLLGYRWETLAEVPEWGIDVGAGGDKTVVWERRGRFLCRRFAVVTADSEEQVDRIVQLVPVWGQPGTIHIDRTGIGWALAGRLQRLSRTKDHPLYGTLVDAVGFGEAGSPPSEPSGKTRSGSSELVGSPGYRCLRDELWWRGRTLTLEGGWDLRTLKSPEHDYPDLDDDVVSELIDPTWDNLGSKGRIRVEAKEHTIARLGRSPDDADTILLAFWPGKARRGRLGNPAALAGAFVG